MLHVKILRIISRIMAVICFNYLTTAIFKISYIELTLILGHGDSNVFCSVYSSYSILTIFIMKCFLTKIID